MKLPRHLLLFCLGILFAFSASAQDLLPHKATYKYVRLCPISSPDQHSAPYVFYEEQLLLDSLVSGAAYYSVQRRNVLDYEKIFDQADTVAYQLIIHDSAIYFTGDIDVEFNSIVHFEKELIFNLKLKKGDNLHIRNSEDKIDILSIIDFKYNTTTKAREYKIESQFSRVTEMTFDSRYGFGNNGLLPYENVKPYFMGTSILLSVCTDSILFHRKNIWETPINELVKNTDFCDSLVYDAFIDAFIASGIEDNPSIFQFSAFPNPFNNQLQVDTEVQMRYSIRSLQGQEILSGQTNKTINTAQLAKGIYLLQLESEDGIAIKKIIKR